MCFEPRNDDTDEQTNATPRTVNTPAEADELTDPTDTPVVTPLEPALA